MRAMTEADRAYYRQQGQLAGFPDCCITYFIDVWIVSFLTNPGIRHYRPRIWQRGYVPCPTCEAAHYATVTREDQGFC